MSITRAAAFRSFKQFLIFTFFLVGSSAQLSQTCKSAVLSWIGTKTGSESCSATLSLVLQNSSHTSACLATPSSSWPSPPKSTIGGFVQCNNPFTLMGLPTKSVVTPKALSDSRFASNCPLCYSPSGVVGALGTSCRNLLTSLIKAVSSSDITADLSVVASSCSSSNDAVQMSMIRYQPEIVCASSESKFGGTILQNFSNGLYLDGALDMRSLSQCGMCSMLPCTPGMLCEKNVEPKLCPSGYYCPKTDVKIVCPQGYFCPEGSIETIKCRDIAAGSCPEGSWRETAWVPFFIALIIVAGVITFSTGLYKFVLKVRVITPDKPEDSQSSVNEGEKKKSTPPEAIEVQGLTVKFDNLRLVSGSNVRLTNVTSEIRPGRFTAIIGGSGAGKTSLMNVLLGREDQTSGTVKFSVAGKELSVSDMRNVVGFVPQTDVMIRDLTVQQLLEHSARTRLPPSLGEAAIMAKVDSVLQRLGIERFRDSVVGNTGDAHALSPGDRKLVNVGMELVADPLALFLDEPTTGLDASSAMNVANITRSLAETGLTVVAVVHQPRGEIYSLIDELIVLVPGGRVAYHGPGGAALRYFADLGFKCSLGANRTDFILDLVSGFIKKEDQDRGSSSSSASDDNNPSTTEAKVSPTKEDFATLWEEKEASFIESLSEREKLSLKANHAALSSELTPATKASLSGRPGILRQILLVFVRALRQRLGSSLLTDILRHLVGGIVLGICTSGGPMYIPPIPLQYKQSCPPGGEVRCTSWLRMMVEPATFYFTMVLGMLSVPPACRSFGFEKEVFAREAFSGFSPFAYYIGKALADIPYLAILSYVFLAPVVLIAPWRGPVEKLFAIAFVLDLFIFSLGYAFSLLIADPDAATLCGVIVAILMNLFGGFVPRLGDGAVWAYTRYSARALVAVELGEGHNTLSSFNTLVPEEHRYADYGKDLLILLLFAAVTHAASVILLLRTNKARKGYLL